MEGAPRPGALPLARPPSPPPLQLGRTPSEIELPQFGSCASLAAVGEAAEAAGPPGLPRVASIDLLRKMLMTQHGTGERAALRAAGGRSRGAGLPFSGGVWGLC